LTLQRLERGDSTGQIKTLEALAAALGTDAGRLLEWRERARRNRAKVARRKLNGASKVG
jgi:transcriptional regulator with XRE-family HTH domain